jgi:hypothetical protein
MGKGEEFMKTRSCAAAIIAAVFCASLSSIASSQTTSPISSTTPKDSIMTKRANGTFEVKLTPQPPEDKTGDVTKGRMLIDKQFHGDLEALSKGQMLTAVTAVKGSAGYVAIEQVSGTLHGRSGAFVLQHSGTMTRGAPQLLVTVVPDSGTEQLVGLSGTMTINIVEGKHFYEFDYKLP